MTAPVAPDRKPDWLRVRFPAGEGHERLRGLMREQGLHTVCEEARCPTSATAGAAAPPPS